MISSNSIPGDPKGIPGTDKPKALGVLQIKIGLYIHLVCDLQK
jgi:hypothetical protein